MKPRECVFFAESMEAEKEMTESLMRKVCAAGGISVLSVEFIPIEPVSGVARVKVWLRCELPVSE